MKVCEQVEILLSSVILLCRSHYCRNASTVLQTIRRDETVFLAVVRLSRRAWRIANGLRSKETCPIVLWL